MRKLATIEVISEILTHDNADSLEIARVRGWQAVVRKGEFKAGDMVVYLEIDSWVPTEIAPFLSKDKEPRVFEGVKGERLRTVKLRGQVSQGLILPISVLDRFEHTMSDGYEYLTGRDPEGNCVIVPLVSGADVTDILGVLKWEAPTPAQLAGQVKGTFPSFVRKTDQERVQNCYNDISGTVDREGNQVEWCVEEKLDGSSCTVYVRFHLDVAEGLYEVGVCSRNMDLKINDENKDNTFIKTAAAAGYLEHLPKLGKSIAVQGELCGPGIQGNKYKLEHPVLFVFDVFSIDEQRYMTRNERWEVLQSLMSLGVKVDQVPHLGTTSTPQSTKDCLAMAEGKSKINPKQEREGIVFKSWTLVNGDVTSFKAISNKFLVSNE